MFEKHTLFHYEVEIDKEETRKWYSRSLDWGCECGDCQNFLKLAEQKLLPRVVLDHLEPLGIPAEKATYVCHLTDCNDRHLYQFSYRIAGNILHTPAAEDVYPAGSEGRCLHEDYPYGAPDFPEPHFDLEFVLELPWVLPHSRDKY